MQWDNLSCPGYWSWRKLSWETNNNVYEQLTDRILPREISDPVVTSSSQTTSCSAPQMFSYPQSFKPGWVPDYLLWDVRIIKETRNKNRSVRSHQSNTCPPDSFYVRSLCRVSACGAQRIQRAPWPLTFPTELKENVASLMSHRRVRLTSSL